MTSIPIYRYAYGTSYFSSCHVDSCAFRFLLMMMLKETAEAGHRVKALLMRKR